MTLEQCKKLKEWGLPQDNKGGMVWTDFGKTFCSYDSLALGDGFVARPDLEQLLEFANGKISDVLMLSPDSHFLSLECPMANEQWIASYTTTTGIDACDPDPKVAVYKLLEKVLA